MQIRPLNGYLLIKPEEAKKQTDSGLLLPTEEDKKTEVAEVISVSSGSDFKAGEKILFKSYATEEVRINDGTYHFLSESDVVAKVE